MPQGFLAMLKKPGIYSGLFNDFTPGVGRLKLYGMFGNDALGGIQNGSVLYFNDSSPCALLKM